MDDTQRVGVILTRWRVVDEERERLVLRRFARPLPCGRRPRFTACAESAIRAELREEKSGKLWSVNGTLNVPSAQFFTRNWPTESSMMP